MCAAYTFNDDEDIRLWKLGDSPPTELLDAVESGASIIAHNAAFELTVWNNCAVPKYNWPVLKLEQTYCTMAMCYAMALPGALAHAAPALGIKAEKDMKGNRIMLQLSKPRGVDHGKIVWWEPEDVPEKFEHMYRYCMQDVNVEREIFRRVQSLSPYEQKTWILDQKINNRGIYIDVKAAKTAIDLVELEKDRLNTEMKRVTHNQVGTCNAVSQIKSYFENEYGMEVPSIAKADLIDLLDNKDLPDDCRNILLLRQEAAKTSTAKLKKMLLGASDLDRVQGCFQYSVATTRRWAGRRVQFQNVPRPKLPQEEIEQVLQTLGEVS